MNKKSMALATLLIVYGGGGLAGLVGVLFTLYTLYLAYLHWKYSHIPSPMRPSGHLPDLWRLQKEIDPEISLTVAVDFWSEKVDSKTFMVFFFHSPIVYTLDPVVIKDVTMNIKNGKTKLFVQAFSRVFGERFAEKGLVAIPNYDLWKPRRQLYDAAFKKTYLKSLTSTFNEMTNATLDQLKTQADGVTKVPLKNTIMKLATDIVSKVAFGTDFSKLWTAESLGIQVPEDSELNVFNYAVNSSLQGLGLTFTSIYPPLNQLLYPSKVMGYKRCVQGLRKIGRDCIMRRIKMIQDGEEIPKDILTYMLSSNQENVNIEELVDDFVTFYVAGQETTAYTMMFAIILITQHPNVLERLRQEVKEILGQRTTVTEHDLEKLQYTEQVVNETLRLYPIAFGQGKKLNSDLSVGNLIIPSGTSVLFMGANMYRKSEYFDNPDVFNPDRFHSDNKKPNSFVFFPFGLGHRSCIGKHFALMEAKMALARIMQTFTIKFPEGYRIQTIQRLTLQPKDDLFCTLSLN